MKPRLLCLLWLLSLTLRSAYSQTCSGGQDEDKPLAPPPRHINIILIGATGDLAKKYLWGSLLDLFTKHYIKGKTAFSIYGCATRSPDEGRNLLSQIMLDLVNCGDDTGCRQVKMDFISVTQYHQLKEEKHYEGLAEKIAENTQTLYGLQGNDWTSEEGRLVYLSIPPSQYAKTARLVHKHLRPKLSNPWMRVVIEKPFGRDLASAQRLSERIGEYFKEEEIYRVDHYLGKPVVKAILPFREKNLDALGSIWNRDHIERVDIVMKETLDCRDRTKFYDSVGILRDVMQNHLTEMLALVAMELPGSTATIKQILSNKLKLLRSVQPLDVSNVLIGQYLEYATEVNIEKNLTDVNAPVSNTPTFAAAVIQINNARWRGVPFVLVSGKKLDEKTSYIRVVFKNTKFCMDKNVDSCKKHSQLVFHISNSDVNKPVGIFASDLIPALRPVFGWKRVIGGAENDFEMFGEHSRNLQVFVSESRLVDAYATLMGAVFEGQRHIFTSQSSLLQAWHIWTDVIKAINQSRPRTYEGLGRDSHVLDFTVYEGRLSFLHAEHSQYIPYDEQETDTSNVSTEFLGSRLVTGRNANEVAKSLALDIQIAAETAISERGVFHLALSGGNSARLLFQELRSSLPLFPWINTHIWQVDERCVSYESQDLNLRTLDEELLSQVPIPFTHVHAMPVSLRSTVACRYDNEDDSPAHLYEEHMRAHLGKSPAFDYVVLGLGSDAHMASLFPNQPALQAGGLVAMVTLPDDHVTIPVRMRMTLTLNVLNLARNASVLVTGREKHEVVQRLQLGEDQEGGCRGEVSECPILGVKPQQFSWFMDYDSLFDKK